MQFRRIERVTAAKGPKGFTLVELLVVIGIIGLLISLLLPALAGARRSATAIKCLANERSIGQAMQLYAADNRGAVLPCQVWGTNAAGTLDSDCWAFLLISGHYLPDPNVQGGALGSPSTNSVLVCPGVLDAPVYDGTVTLASPYDIETTAGVKDGYERRVSKILLNESSPPDPVGNGANGACILDVGYAVNGASDGITYTETVNGRTVSLSRNLPMQAVSVNSTGAARSLNSPLTKFSQFHRSAETVLLFDGSGWDPFAHANAAHLADRRGAVTANGREKALIPTPGSVTTATSAPAPATSCSWTDTPHPSYAATCRASRIAPTVAPTSRRRSQATCPRSLIRLIQPLMIGNDIVWSLAQQIGVIRSSGGRLMSGHLILGGPDLSHLISGRQLPSETV